MPTESLLLIVDEPEVFCYVDFGAWWKRLLTGGCEGSGSLCLTDRRLVFLKSSVRQRLACRGPRPETIEELTEILSTQRGREIPLSLVGGARLSAKGRGTYGGYGVTDISEIAVDFGEARRTVRFRFADGAAAERVLQRLDSILQPALGHVESPVSPLEDELLELEIPIDFGLPATPQDVAWVTWLRATAAFALRTYRAEKYRFAVNDAEKLIGDRRLQEDRRFQLILAAAYYVRGLAREALDDHTAAVEDHREALRVFPGYAPARRMLDK